jgi:hypothetical protein
MLLSDAPFPRPRHHAGGLVTAPTAATTAALTALLRPRFWLGATTTGAGSPARSTLTWQDGSAVAYDPPWAAGTGLSTWGLGVVAQGAAGNESSAMELSAASTDQQLPAICQRGEAGWWLGHMCMADDDCRACPWLVAAWLP